MQLKVSGVEVRGVARPTTNQIATVGGEAALSDVIGNIFGVHTQGEYAAYGESERRSIYGEASPDQAKELHEEGIEFHPLPVLPDERN